MPEGAWSDGNLRNTHETVYPADQPADYVVEGSTVNPMPPSLMQRRSYSYYPVTSTIGARDPEVMAWSDGNMDSTDE